MQFLNYSFLLKVVGFQRRLGIPALLYHRLHYSYALVNKAASRSTLLGRDCGMARKPSLALLYLILKRIPLAVDNRIPNPGPGISLDSDISLKHRHQKFSNT